ncbi:MFS transporter [Micromonospora sp. WMMD1082]|uniref:MFS transporter n=1 Tax=Micromonospora sp. WMMD1082 TaxID=3016104 RepID=UPI002415BCBF|nr:MFS transporter [Micromonospora sp. WMMD1082]MDG4798801.1 MFS transporter [Micromonospora sp. WMMD1082]
MRSERDRDGRPAGTAPSRRRRAVLVPPGGGVPTPPRRVRWAGAVAALGCPPFRAFWVGAICASTATWMLNLTVPLLLYQATGRALWAGLGAFAQFVPAMLGSPVGGVLADRYPRRAVLAVTQLVALAVALLLALLSRDGTASPLALLALVAAAGAANGVQTPAWQSLIPQLVPPRHLLNAIALNAMQANAARALGPVLATAVLVRSGSTAAFLVAAGANVTMLLALATIRPRTPAEPAPPEPMFARLRGGVRYTRRVPGLLVAVLLAGCVSFVGTPIVQLAAVFATDVYDAGTGGAGLLASGLGIGAVLGAVLLSVYGSGRRRSGVAGVALAVHGLATFALAAAPTLWLGFAAVVVLGTSYLAVLSTANVTVQVLAPDALRGRVASLYWMAFAGAYPAGALVQSWLADVIGVRWAVALTGLALGVVVVALRRRRLLDALDADADVPTGR